MPKPTQRLSASLCLKVKRKEHHSEKVKKAKEGNLMAISEHFHLNPTKAVDSAFCCKGEARRTEAIQGKMRCLPLLFFCQILIYHYLSLLE